MNSEFNHETVCEAFTLGQTVLLRRTTFLVNSDITRQMVMHSFSPTNVPSALSRLAESLCVLTKVAENPEHRDKFQEMCKLLDTDGSVHAMAYWLVGTTYSAPSIALYTFGTTRATIHALMTQDAFRGRQLATRLLHHLVEHLEREAPPLVTHVVVYVGGAHDGYNVPALYRLYTRLGFTAPSSPEHVARVLSVNDMLVLDLRRSVQTQ